MKKDRYERIAEEIHDRWCRANTDHLTERGMLAHALLEAYFAGVDSGRASVISKGGGVTIIRGKP